jgi:hypothetical protein
MERLIELQINIEILHPIKQGSLSDRVGRSYISRLTVTPQTLRNIFKLILSQLIPEYPRDMQCGISWFNS